ncbi:MAG: hypothetical protein BGP24_09135 [Lysobacterales bacterium 69-70]|nr:MAG: hypothetical protein ABS97_12160 [Xanthomonadaceae bacterium SCN 69-320]ODV20545.1 MAG: hypothetical protein ABT27_07515 [Xanthomonadaceae bacterium SCN 69-25]OJZ00673.1 MAG: hypothetical protein BGP24_09135 [Xanthomonadales bacterium 69-70]
MNVRKPPALALLRVAVDLVDDGLTALLAARRGLVDAIATVRACAGLPTLDPAREQGVQRRAQALARRLGLPAMTARHLIDLLITDARRQQAACSAAWPTKPSSTTAFAQSPAGTDRRARV